MAKTYLKTEKLKDAKFRGQRALVVAALNAFSTPKTVEEIEEKANGNGEYTKLLNEWAKENGGAHASILYHLRALDELGMVKAEGEADTGPKPTKKKDKKTTPPKKAAEFPAKKPPVAVAS